MQFPLDARFKLLAIASQIAVTDASGTLRYYAKQKAFKLREAVSIFADREQTRLLFTIEADRILDISARYQITDAGGADVAVLQRQGMRSLWRTHYTVEAGAGATYTIREENPWVKVADGVFSGIPILGMFSGYLFHPRYVVSAPDGREVLRVQKKPAAFEGRFEISRPGATGDPVEPLVIGVVMMLLLERERG